jgi:hypothetical protein
MELIDSLLIPWYFLLQCSIEVIKKLDDVRVLESRKSARLMDQTTDFARLADMSDRKRSSSSQNAVEISG